MNVNLDGSTTVKQFLVTDDRSAGDQTKNAVPHIAAFLICDLADDLVRQSWEDRMDVIARKILAERIWQCKTTP